MITRVNNITQINNKALSNAFVLGQLTADYDDSTAIGEIALTSTQIALEIGDKFLISGVEFTVKVAASATATALTVDTLTPSIPLLIGDSVEINQDNLFIQYQRKTEGTIGGMPVGVNSMGPIDYDPDTDVYSITGVDPTYVKVLPRDFLINEDGGYEALEFKDASNTGLQVGDADQEMVATVNIPYGTTATHVTVWGTPTTKVVDVHECNVSANGKSASLGAGVTDGVAFAITNTVSTATNYLLIIVKVTATSNRIFGGKVTLTQN